MQEKTVHRIPDYIGPRVRQLRVAGRENRTDLARRAGVSTATVQRLEESETVNVHNLLAVAAALKVTPGDLLDPPEVIARRKASSNGAISSEALADRLLELADLLSDPTLEAITRLSPARRRKLNSLVSYLEDDND